MMPEKKELIQICWSIRWKLMAVMAIMIVSLVLILTFIQISSQKSVLEEELKKRIALMRENLIERGKSVSMNLAHQVENQIAAFNFSGMLETVQFRVDGNEEIKYAMLVDSSGVVYIHTLHPELVQTQLDTERDRLALSQTRLTVLDYQEAEDSVIEMIVPIQISTQPWGVLRLVYTLKHLQREINLSQTQIRQEITRMISNSILTSAGFMAVAFAVGFLLSTRFSRPLVSLTQAARELSRGNFAAPMNLHIHSHDEVGVLATSFLEMSQELKASYQKLEEYNRTLEQKVQERTQELNTSLLNVEKANQKIMESLQYAKVIQHSLLPNQVQLKTYLPESFFLWMPRDVVSGDIFYTECLADRVIIAIMDCTGHGVPGAFMTMIATSGLKRILQEDGDQRPAEILKRLNGLVKTSLQQDTDYALSDDGLDAAICVITPKDRVLRFASARLPLFVAQDDDVRLIKGDRQSLGYKRSSLEFQFTEQAIKIEPDMAFYLATDGFIDQLGGKMNRRLGSGRFRKLVREYHQKPYDQQQILFLQAFQEYKGDRETQDDVTVVGFGMRNA
ncbi:serine phosphatase [Candidatus Vecturithrix granuli]|uniref:Serine phosphatase n=1 Tax=Vecturithrix granuli TaxID=1499967 RepID=A0A081C460_VECG1|nr:serine phosphatase [Candidatus Vecturithrix granuli]